MAGLPAGALDWPRHGIYTPCLMGKNDSIEVVKTDLQIEEELEAHKSGWAFQRAGFIFIFALILLAAAGFFGDGLASKNSVSRDQITVEFERFYRFDARMPIRIHLTHTSSGELIVIFPSHYLQNFRIESIQPEPKENIIRDGEVFYVFNGTGSMDVTFFLIPQSRGNIEGEVDVDGKTFSLKHFIFP